MPSVPKCREFERRPGAKVWRVSRWTRRCAAVGGVGFGLFFCAVTWPDDRALAIAMLLGALTLSWLGAIRPWLGTDRSEIVVANIVRSKQFSTSEFLSAENGYSGIEIMLRDGRSIDAWAVQESNLMVWLNRPTRSDKIVDYLNSLNEVG